MDQLKILLLCGSRFALPAMRDLVNARLLSVVVIPSHCKDFLLEVTQLLQPLRIPVISVNKNSSDEELKKAIKKYDVNMALMMTYSFKIPAAVYDLPVKGFYNFHPGSLPEYRGADPVFQQIANKEKHAAVTVHKLDEGMDTGPVVIKEMIKINTDDTYGILHAKLGELASKLCAVLIKMSGFDIAVPSRAQDESKAKYYARQTAKDIVVNWEAMSADDIIALINACNPWNKGAIASINNKIIRLLEATKKSSESATAAQPGTVIAINEDGLQIAAKDNETLVVTYVYIDEGFLKAGKLSNIAIVAGNRFTSL